MSINKLKQLRKHIFDIEIQKIQFESNPFLDFKFLLETLFRS